MGRSQDRLGGRGRGGDGALEAAPAGLVWGRGQRGRTGEEGHCGAGVGSGSQLLCRRAEGRGVVLRVCWRSELPAPGWSDLSPAVHQVSQSSELNTTALLSHSLNSYPVSGTALQNLFAKCLQNASFIFLFVRSDRRLRKLREKRWIKVDSELCSLPLPLKTLQADRSSISVTSPTTLARAPCVGGMPTHHPAALCTINLQQRAALDQPLSDLGKDSNKQVPGRLPLDTLKLWSVTHLDRSRKCSRS